MRRYLPLLVFVLLAGACSQSDGAAPRTVATTTTAVTATSTAPPTSPTTTPPPSTTSSTTTTTTTVPLDEVELAVVEVATGFEQPVFVTALPGDPRLFVVDQPGRIWVIDGGDPAEFLDLRDDVAFGGERGLLGMAFHPDHAANGRFYVHYSAASDGGTRIVEYRVGDDPNRADPSSARLVFSHPQPASNHNGGMIAFGPDGYLWIALGDGGAANDRFGNGQRADTALGALLRIDVGPGAPEPYGVPPDNPYVDGGGAPEVWAIGLRNPWRFSFDGDTVYLADVGQNRIEEVDVAPATAAGLNYGWPIMEGSSCFQSDDCDPTGLVAPAIEYTHDDGCSITGGYVYRGSAIPAIAGHYFYSDWCSGFLRSFRWDGTAAVDAFDWTEEVGSLRSITSFGIDGAGELYLTSATGVVYRLVSG